MGMISGRIIVFSFIILSGCFSSDSKNSLKRFRIDNPDELKEFFSYSPDRIPFISAHRGGDREMSPENCIATFENTLSKVHSMIEVDPRYSKDSVMVLMHDATLDRTTNGTGRVSDYNYEELKKLRLKDSKGNITDYHIPTLDEALNWAKGKTILVLDRKDVPMAARVKKIEEHNAVTNAIVIAYSLDEIRECYNLNPDIIMEVMLPDAVQLKKLDETGVPWTNMVGFVSHNLVEDKEIFDLIHEKGAMCIVGSSRNHDISYKKGEIESFEELAGKYRKMVTDGADIIEADLAIEAGLSIRDIKTGVRSGSKSKFFSDF
jgi:glycerophosphoryl diester phosphodiesterase